MSIRISPIHPGQTYLICCNGQNQIVFATHGADALMWYIDNILGGL